MQGEGEAVNLNREVWDVDRDLLLIDAPAVLCDRDAEPRRVSDR